MKRSVNKSALVREALKAHPNKGNKELAEIIGKGVTAQTVANVKASTKTTSGKEKKSKRNNGTLSVDDLMKVNKLVQDLGGIKVVQHGLEVLSQFKA
jgi:hypothetical protein